MTDLKKQDELSDLDATDKNPEPNDAQAEALASLQNRSVEVRNNRLEERFFFIIAIVVLINALLFKGMETWAGPIVIGLLELVGLVVAARKCSVVEVDQLIDKFMETPPLKHLRPPRREQLRKYRQWRREHRSDNSR